MSTSSPSPDARADEQAALWAARLEGAALDAADRAELDAWLAADPAHRSLLARYCQFSADLEEQLPLLVAAGKVAMPPEPAPRRRPLFRWLAPLALAAAAAVAVGVWIAQPKQQLENIATSLAQRQSVTLADGTQVELNARTALRIESTRSERRVRLADGEAFFTVAKDSSRPFIVETPSGSVRVTGTAFNVRAAAAELEVIVVEGTVQVRATAVGDPRSGVPMPLTANDRLVASPAGISVEKLPSEKLNDALAWRAGQIVFDGTPLREAAAHFAHHHGRRIVVLDGAAEHSLGGVYSLDDLETFFAGLETSFPVKVHRDLSGTTQIAPRSEQ